MALQSVRVGLTLAFAIVASGALAQEPSKLPRVAYLWPAWPGHVQEAYMDGLRAAKYVEGKSIIVDWRFAEGHPIDFRP
jgi:hypothetical protein